MSFALFGVDLGSISTLVATLVALFSVIWMIKTSRTLKSTLAEYKPLIERIAALFRYEENEEGQPMLDAGLVKMIDALGSRITKSFTMTGLQQLSSGARIEKGLEGAIATDLMEEKAPIVGLISDFLGLNTKKYIAKHPRAIGQLAQMFAPQIQALIQGRNNGSGRSSGRVPEMR